MKTVFETNNGLEAEEVRAFLLAYEIESIIVGKPEDRSNAFDIHSGEEPIRVMVMEEKYEEAIGLLNSTPEEEPPA